MIPFDPNKAATRQYKYTSADFVPEGETGDPDAYMSPEDLAALQNIVNPSLPPKLSSDSS